MSCSSYLKKRDAELYLCYWLARRDNPELSHNQAIAKAVKSPTSRYWGSPYQVYREILNLIKGRGLSGKIKAIRRKQVYDIYEVYLRLSHKPTFRHCSVFFILQFAIAEPGPEFYLSFSRALSIINRYKRDYVIEERRKA